ncbi:MAG: class I SAM-dependent methyltransferase, partial [Asticcacaulis sp.]
WGATVTGMDISPECVALARREEPALRFDVMDMAEMTYEDARFDGIVAYYALHYLPKSRLSQVMGEFARVLRPGGQLLLVAKDGDGEDWVDDPLGVTGKVFWCALNPEALQVLVAANGFDVIGCKVRAPEANEIAAPRIYVTARRKG